MDREQQSAYLEQVLTPKQLRHSLGVMQIMGELAEVYELEQEKALTGDMLNDRAFPFSLEGDSFDKLRTGCQIPAAHE